MEIQAIRDVNICGNPIPPSSKLVGYAALIQEFNVKAPIPKNPSVLSDFKIRTSTGTNHIIKDGFSVYPSSLEVEDTVGGHLTFALKNEGIDLFLLKRIFNKIPESAIIDFIKENSAGQYKRLVWFYYEWLFDKRLDSLPDLAPGKYIDAIDPDIWQTSSPIFSQRHLVRNNLPGTSKFCPLIKKIEPLISMVPSVITDRIRHHMEGVPVDHVSRMTKRLLLKDSKSSFLIESENPSNHRLQQWGDIVASAKDRPLSIDLLIELQKKLMQERRFISTGLRRSGVFLGDRVDGMPIPTWIGARPCDLQSLLEGLVEADKRMSNSNIDPVSQAAAIAFGFVYMHPFEDGNGRIHRYIMQHILANRNMTPMGINLSVSKAIWNNIEGYHDALRNLDEERLPLIDWTPTNNGNVEVNDDTSDIYRFFNATPQAIFLSSCVDHVIDYDIPNEFVEIKRYDQILKSIKDIVDMPDNNIEKIVSMILQNSGSLSRNKRKNYFPTLTDDEVQEIESAVIDVYEVDNEKNRISFSR